MNITSEIARQQIMSPNLFAYYTNRDNHQPQCIVCGAPIMEGYSCVSRKSRGNRRILYCVECADRIDLVYRGLKK